MTARQPRQSSSPGGGAGGESRGDCLFGSGVDVDLCDWGNVPFSAFEWLPSNGKDSYWIGGPRKDSNANNELGEWAGRLDLLYLRRHLEKLRVPASWPPQASTRNLSKPLLSCET